MKKVITKNLFCKMSFSLSPDLRRHLVKILFIDVLLTFFLWFGFINILTHALFRPLFLAFIFPFVGLLSPEFDSLPPVIELPLIILWHLYRFALSVLLLFPIVAGGIWDLVRNTKAEKA